MRILVVGDVMIDRYWYGDVHRVSPEAPVPVLHVKRIENRAGGAANVALNCKAMGANVTLLGIVGQNDPMSEFFAGIDTALVRCDKPTTVKLRLICRNHQLTRADFEEEPPGYALEGLRTAFLQSIHESDHVIFSDYGKGALKDVSWMIEEAAQRGKTTFVDPKGRDWSKYRGATLIKPNTDEMREAIGEWKVDAELYHKAHELRKAVGIEKLLLTRASEGMTLFDPEGTHHFPAVAREIFDVTGAGDTAIAAMAAFGDVGIANRAAGLACGKFGTAVVTKEELGVS